MQTKGTTESRTTNPSTTNVSKWVDAIDADDVAEVADGKCKFLASIIILVGDI